MTHYLTGLIAAYLAFGLVCALGVVPLMVLTGQAHRASEFVSMWVGFGVPTVVILAAIVGPGILGLDRLLTRRLPVVVAVLVGAAVGPCIILLAWLVFREGNESFGGLLQFWLRVPGEFLVGALPPAAAGAFFCVWITRTKPRLKLPAA
jgi:arginine exporter protein ArgO